MVFEYRNGVFPLGTWKTVFCIGSPAIQGTYSDSRFLHVDHRFDRKGHSRNDQTSRTLLAVMEDERIFMKFNAHAVAAIVSDDLESVAGSMLFNGIADITQETPWPDGFQTQFQTLLGDSDEPFVFRACFTDNEHAAGITIITVIDRGAVNIDNVSGLQDLSLTWNAMAYHVID